jgi:hypothetical protein
MVLPKRKMALVESSILYVPVPRSVYRAEDLIVLAMLEVHLVDGESTLGIDRKEWDWVLLDV